MTYAPLEAAARFFGKRPWWLENMVNAIVRAELLRLADVCEDSASWSENNFISGPNSEYAIRRDRDTAEWLREVAYE